MELNPQGVGLGLMISNRLIHMMGSKRGITVSSKYKLGSEFSFEMPQQNSESQLMVEEVAIEIEHKRPVRETAIESPCDCRSVLSVEDNDYNQMVIEKMMKKLGFEVTKAFNGEEAIEILKSGAQNTENRCRKGNCTLFNVIITDLQMPIMDGICMINEIRKLPESWCKIPIILLSATDENEQIEEGFKAGMNNFLTKPLTEEALKDCLKSYKILHD
eukprot:TRINITY_DN4253_c0_g2_i1.p1 TRINITY_DN4253_c0_g2~~TRINITY_DN4253_c0_g2_i1.p1  ORF type:complete len:217 (-),score=27.80 TRINITY_DN4253_c0_g2_i1:51-701(-)